MNREIFDWSQVVNLAEAEHIADLHSDMIAKKQRYQSGSGKNTDRFYREFQAAEDRYWSEIERITGGEDHEEMFLLSKAWLDSLNEIYNQGESHETQFYDDDGTPFNDYLFD